MYENYYGFREPPFRLTPDPRFLFFAEGHQEAYNHILFGIRERKGFIQFTGEVGTGKTTICRALLERLEPRYRTALILNPSLTATQLLRAILTELGLETRRADRRLYLDTLNRFLLEQVGLGHDVVLIIDEAQNLGEKLLEEVRLLSNLETNTRKLLQIVLVGQPELRNLLNRRRLRQLRQRITVRYHLGPLTQDETEQYILFRLHVAGGNSRPRLTRAALRKIHHHTGGVPRLINALCDRALLCGYVQDKDDLTAGDIRRSIRDLEGETS